MFDPLGLHAFDLPKSLYSRAFAWLIGGVLIAAMLRYGTGIIPSTRLHLAAAGVLLAYALATVFAEDRYIALFGESERYLGLTLMVDFFVLYVATSVAFRAQADWFQLFATLAAVTVVVIAYATVQYMGLDPVRWIDDPRTRPFATVGNPDQFAHYLSIVFGSAAATALFTRSRPLVLGAGMLALAAAVTASIVATRATLFAFVLILFLLLIARTWRSDRRGRAAVLSIGGVMLVGGAIAAIMLFTPLGERARQTVASDPSVQVRLLLIQSAAAAFRDRPLFGVGPDNLGVVYPRYRQEGSSSVIGVGARQDSAHNFVLQAAATSGLAGLLAWSAFMAAYAGAALRLTGAGAAAPAAAALLFAGVGYWSHALVTPGMVAVDWLPWVGLGALGGAGAPRGPEHPGRRPTFVFAAAVVALSVAGSVTGWWTLAANRNAATAIELATVNPKGATDAANAATVNDPRRAEYWNTLGIALEAGKDWTAAAAAYERAAVAAPYDWGYVSNIARTRLRQAEVTNNPSDGAAALAAAERAVEIDPREPLAQIALVQTALALGQHDVALRALERAFTLHPRFDYDVAALAVARRASDLPAARQLMQKLLDYQQTATRHLALAEIALRQGDEATARMQAQRVLALLPQNADARRILTATGP